VFSQKQGFLFEIKPHSLVHSGMSVAGGSVDGFINVVDEQKEKPAVELLISGAIRRSPAQLFP